MYVKITIPQREGCPSLYEIYETPSCRFEVRPWEVQDESPGSAPTFAGYACMVVDGRPYEALVPGMVYLLNDRGDTIDSWSPTEAIFAKRDEWMRDNGFAHQAIRVAAETLKT